MWKYRWKFGSKNVAFLASLMSASSMIRVFPSLEHSAGHVRHTGDNGRTFWCVGHAPSDCPNVEETRNSMQTFNRKKCSHFSPTNIPSAFPSEIGRMYFLSYSLAHQKGTACFKWQSLFSFRYMLRHAHLIHTFHRSSALFYGNNLRQISWLIYIESLIGRHIVREQLQCHRCRQHHELILHIRQRENFVLLR